MFISLFYITRVFVVLKKKNNFVVEISPLKWDVYRKESDYFVT